MPFVSKQQIRACFARKDPRWNCRQWLEETPNYRNLPNFTTKKVKAVKKQKKRTQRNNRLGGYAFDPRSDKNDAENPIKVELTPVYFTQTSVYTIDVAIFVLPFYSQNAIRVSPIKRLRGLSYLDKSDTNVLFYNPTKENYLDTFYLVWSSAYGMFDEIPKFGLLTELSGSNFEEHPVGCWTFMDRASFTKYPQKVQVSGLRGIGSRQFSIPPPINQRFSSGCYRPDNSMNPNLKNSIPIQRR